MQSSSSVESLLGRLALVAAVALGAACTAAPESTSTPPATQLVPTATPTAPATVQATATPGPQEPMRLVYIGGQGDIHVTTADGSERVTVTDAADDSTSYAWPTWDPTGRRIAFSSLHQTSEQSVVSLMVADTDGSDAHAIHTQTGGPSVPLVATNAPHYIYWSPDGETIAFLAAGNQQQGLTLYLVNVESGAVEEVISGSPLYFVWDDIGKTLLLHVEGELQVVDTMLSPRPAPLGPSSLLYATPAWGPGSIVTYVGQTSQGDAFFASSIAKVADGTGQPLLPTTGRSAFFWSPRQDYLAIALTSSPQSFAYNGIFLVDVTRGTPQSLVEETIFAFFWSPNGRKIAYVTPSEEAGVVHLKVVAARGGLPRTLATFKPTQDLAVYLSFFSQYGYSHSIWSPDSRYLVIAEAVAEGEKPRIMLLDSENAEAPHELAEGSLAFWAPR